MKDFRGLNEWIAAELLLLIIIIYWLALTVVKSPVLAPVIIVSLFKKQSVVFGKTVIWRAWAINMVLADDQNVNALLGGDRDITISSRVGYNAIHGNAIALKMEPQINIIFKILINQENHCRASIQRDENHNKNWGG